MAVKAQTKDRNMTDKAHIETEQSEDNLPLKDISSLETIYDRKKLLEISASLIEDTYTRLSGPRFRPREGDRERLAYLRTLTQLLSLHTSILHAAQAPAWEGLPAAPTQEDLELEEARKREFEDLERSLYNLPPKKKAKARA